MEHIVFLTGHLALPSLEHVLRGLQGAPFTWEARDLGLQVAALMTGEMIRRRVATPVRADRIIVPGRCRGDMQALSQHFGVAVQRGPEELKDLPGFFNREAQGVALDTHATAIFAEIVDAPRLTVAQIVERGRQFAAAGADVIDLGCLPETPFGHLGEAVQALKAAGLAVSVDSVDVQELLRGGRAGADYLLSLTLDTLWVADEVAATPVLPELLPSSTERSSIASGDISTMRGAPLPLYFCLAVWSSHAVSSARNAGRPAGPANDSL